MWPPEATYAKDSSGNVIGLVGTYGTIPLPLLPSGGDDGPAMAEMCAANRGLVLLGPGVFKVNSYTLLVSPITQYYSSTVSMGVQIIGCGEGVTVIDTTGLAAPCYTKIAITSITAAAASVFTLASGEGAKIANNDVLRLDVVSGMIQANQQDFTVTGLAGDSFTATNINGTLAGATAWSTSSHNFAKLYSGSSNPVFRITPPISSVSTRKAGMSDVLIERISFVGNTDVTGVTKNTQRLFAFETDEAAGTAGGATLDTRTGHKTVFRNVQAFGYECAVHVDDCTNVIFDSCDMKGNQAVLWAGYNTDIITLFHTHIGSDYAVTNIAHGIGLINVPAPFADGNGTSANSIMFDSCWVLDAESSFQIASCSGSVTWKNCYFERIRKIGDLGNGYSAAFEGCKFSSFSDTGYTRPSIVIQGNTVKQRITMRECSSGATIGPASGFFDVSPHASRERYWPNILWENNSLGYLAGKGHIKTDSAYMILTDNHDTAGGTYLDQNSAGGLYYFEGPIQTGGHERVQELASASNSIIPNLLDGTCVWVSSLTENTTIGVPTNRPTLSAAFALRRMLPLRFMIKQDATAGRTIAWNAIYKFHTAFVDAIVTTDANKVSEIEFRWDGASWRQSSPTNVWTV